MKLFKVRQLAWMLPLLFLLVWASFLISNILTDNFHTVMPGQLYRSAQLRPMVLLFYVKKYDIRSVVNLRGPHPDSPWYRGEMMISKHQGLAHYDITLPAHGLPTEQGLQRLVQVMKTAPKPILVHCRQGADRTGLASAIAVILSGRYSRDKAIYQMTWRYNVLSPSTVGYQVMRNYFAWLKRVKQSFGKQSFLQWVALKPKLKRYHGVFVS